MVALKRLEREREVSTSNFTHQQLMEMERKKNDVVLRFGAKEREDATKRYQTLRRKGSRFGIGFGAGTA
jgi:hypothetical protein